MNAVSDENICSFHCHNVTGIGTSTLEGRLHVKDNADASQLILGENNWQVLSKNVFNAKAVGANAKITASNCLVLATDADVGMAAGEG